MFLCQKIFIMTYHEYFSLFTGTINGNNRLLTTDTGTLLLHWIDFRSENQTAVDLTASHYSPDPKDKSIGENNVFKLPVIRPMNCGESEQAIILIHGLNERSWNKYWSWAAYLAEKLQRPVILFPISFHINRAPAFWSDARTVSDLMKQSNSPVKNSDSTTFVNYMLSGRLIRNPLRFLTSGLQSALDLQRLTRLIENEQINDLCGIRQIDIMAYSIGAFLSQILLIYNYLTGSNPRRTSIFCGGAPFSGMNGVSRFIMNREAFETIRRFYLNETLNEIREKTPLGRFLTNNPLGQAFNAMTAPDRSPSLVKSAFSAYKNIIQVITLAKDTVIPSNSTINLFKNTPVTATQLDFNFSYTHENPFPVYQAKESQKPVDMAFASIFESISSFIAH